MSKQINQYTKTRTQGTVQNDDLLDFDSTEDSGSTYESAKITVQDFLAYLNSNVNNIYTSNGSLPENRLIASQTYFTAFLGGDVITRMVDETFDYAFLVQDLGSVERGRLGYDQTTASGNLVLSSFTDGIWLNAVDGNVGIGHSTPLYGLDIQKDTYALNVEGTSPIGNNAFRMVIDQEANRNNLPIATMSFEGDATNINTAGLLIAMNQTIAGTSPALQLNGTPNSEYGALFTLKGGTTFSSDLGGTDAFNYRSDVGILNIGFIGNAASKLFVFNQNALANVVRLSDSTGTKNFTITDAGVASYTGIGVKMGIGTATPLAKTHIFDNADNSTTRLLIESNAGNAGTSNIAAHIKGNVGSTTDRLLKIEHTNIAGTGGVSNPQLIEAIGGSGNYTGGTSVLAFGVSRSSFASFGEDVQPLIQLNVSHASRLNANLLNGTITSQFKNDYANTFSEVSNISKTGVKISSTGTFNNTGAGEGVNTGLQVDVSGGNINYAALFNGGNVGIGTATPNSTLDVIGDISSTEGYDLANNLFIHSTRNGNRSDTASGNVFLGQSTALSVSTGTNNVGIGFGTLGALNSGFANIAIGSLSLDSNTVGRDNVSIGFNSFGSLFDAAVGNCSFNTAIGQSAFTNTVIAGGVVGIGVATGQNITNGTALTLLGRNTGATTAGTYLNSVAIGAYAQFNGNNQCVFGAQTAAATLDNFYFGAGIEQTTINPLKISFNVTNISAGQTDTASDYNWEFNGSRGTGTGAGGDIYFQTAPSGTTGTAQNALVEALRIKQSGVINMGNLPTSSAGLSSGDLWNNSGVINIV